MTSDRKTHAMAIFNGVFTQTHCGVTGWLRCDYIFDDFKTQTSFLAFMDEHAKVTCKRCLKSVNQMEADAISR